MHIYLQEVKKILSRKQFLVIFLCFMGIVFFDYYLTTQYYIGRKLSEIPSAYDLTVISNYCDAGISYMFFRTFFYFLLTALLGADIFYAEKELGLSNMIFTRIKRERYICIQVFALMSVVFATVVFSILISLILALSAFPIQGYMLEDMTAYNILLPHPTSLFSMLEAHAPYLNYFVYMILWGITGAIFAFFGYAFSFLEISRRYSVLLFPAVVFLIYSEVLSQINYFVQDWDMHLAIMIDTYLLKINGSGSYWMHFGTLAVIVVISIGMIWRGLKHDNIL